MALIRRGRRRGLSPHGRGKHACWVGESRRSWSIPARAGETVTAGGSRRRDWVYPRTGGGNGSSIPFSWQKLGLSPHGRGKPPPGIRISASLRSIPARAGETCRCSGVTWRIPVYPRTGGGNPVSGTIPGIGRGLSPHGRGKLLRIGAKIGTKGSIPARAGETRTLGNPTLYRPVYPRTGGGNPRPCQPTLPIPGLSPHGRGKRRNMPACTDAHRSIPARAGETRSAWAIRAVSRVYPRTGGGNAGDLPSALSVMGLSPHGRGKRG